MVFEIFVGPGDYAFGSHLVLDEFLDDASLGDDVSKVDEGDLHGDARQEEGNVVEVIENKDRLLHQGGLEGRGAGSDEDELAEVHDIVHGFVYKAVAILIEILESGLKHGLEVRPRAGDEEESIGMLFFDLFCAFEHGGEDPLDLVLAAAGEKGDELFVFRDAVFGLEVRGGLEFFYLVDDPMPDVPDLHFARLFELVLGDGESVIFNFPFAAFLIDVNFEGEHDHHKENAFPYGVDPRVAPSPDLRGDKINQREVGIEFVELFCQG